MRHIKALNNLKPSNARIITYTWESAEDGKTYNTATSYNILNNSGYGFQGGSLTGYSDSMTFTLYAAGPLSP